MLFMAVSIMPLGRLALVSARHGRILNETCSPSRSMAGGKAERVTFEGSDGQRLAARLDAPDEEARAYALFAHCFTCGKDVFAAARIAQRLTEPRIGVARVDLSRLGA